MTKHHSDSARGTGSTRLREFTRQDRESGTHPAIETLRSRPKARSADNRRLAEFTRIERHGETV